MIFMFGFALTLGTVHHQQIVLDLKLVVSFVKTTSIRRASQGNSSQVHKHKKQ